MTSFRRATSDDLTAARIATVTDMLLGYNGSHPSLASYASRIRAGGQLTGVEILRVLNADHPTPVAAAKPKAQVLDGTYTIVMGGSYRTIRLTSDTSWMTTPPASGTRVAQLLIGPDNETSFKGFAFVRPDGSVQPWRSAGVDAVTFLEWLLANGAGQEAALGKAYAVRSGRCCFCNRKLTTPASTYYGYGPDCADRNGLPWGDAPKAAPAVLAATEAQADAATDVIAMVSGIAAAEAARVGWQSVHANPATIANPDGSVTSTAAAAHARYRELFGDD